MRGRSWAAVVALGIGLGGCGSASVAQPGDAGGGDAPAPVVRGDAGTPAGEYLSTKVIEGGEPRDLVPGTRISLTFDGGTVRASAGCNTMSGSARFDDGRLFVEDLAQTEMGCPGDGRHEQDEFVATFLLADPAYEVDGAALKLRGDDARIVLEPRDAVEPDLPLAGPRWEVTHVTAGPPRDAAPDPGAAVSAAEPPREAELEFTADGVLGFAGCVTFEGPATRSGDTIRFGELQVDLGRCAPNAGPNNRGTVVTDVLSGAVDVDITATAMTLTNASGGGLALLADRPPAEPRDCKGSKCLDFDLGDDECDRGGKIVTTTGRRPGNGSTVYDGPATLAGSPTPGITLGRSDFDDQEPRPAYTYELHERSENRVLAYRKIDDRVVGIASIGRTQAGGWHLDSTTERTC